MPREIKMPKLSDTMEEGTINVWRKAEGEPIEKGDILLEVETDKADMEFEAYMAGSLARILVPAGETVAVGTPIAVARLERDSDEELATFLARYTAGAQPAAAATSVRAEAPAPSAASASSSSPSAATASASSSAAAAASTAPPVFETPRGEAPGSAAQPGSPAPLFDASPIRPTSRLPFFLPDPDRVRSTPRARVLAQERNVDLSEIAGSGPDGAVLVADVERYLEFLETSAPPVMEGDVPVTPVAQRIAEEVGVDLSQLKGTGPGGRITKRDVRNHLEQVDLEGPGRDQALFGDEVRLSQKRKYLIGQMVESKRTTPHFYVSRDVDVEPLRALRESFKQQGRHITYTHLIVKAAALALTRFPEVNVTFREDRILRYNPINIAVAVDVQSELVAPVVKDCQGRDLEELARATDELIRRAREKKLKPADYSDGTFSISNLGMLGIDHFYAIITPPQSTVLSVGSMRKVPVADGSEIRVGHRMTFGLAVDHRVVDGARAAEFLAGFADLLESPQDLLVSHAAHGG